MFGVFAAIGVSYRFRELMDPNDWCPFAFDRIITN
jgi:hypothetical protein